MGSSPTTSTFALFCPIPWQRIGFTLGGLVAGEGSFTVTERPERFVADGSPRLRFLFQVEISARDRPLLEALRNFLDAGSIRDTAPRRKGWQPLSTYRLWSERAHLHATIPFAEEFLLPCAKRDQFEVWQDRLVAYATQRPSRYGRGPSPCREPGCSLPVRGRGLCRRHYYRATGY